MIRSSNKEFATKRAAIVRAACKKFPDTAARTLARKLVNEHPRIFDDVEQARKLVRYQFGVFGDKCRERANDKSLFREKRKPGQLPPLPKSLAKPKQSHVLDTKRLLVLSDIHVPYQDNDAVEAALEFGEKFAPDTILLNGDIIDFEAISRFARDPRGPTLKEELASLKDMLTHIRQRFPKAAIKYRMGNHEERWEHLLWRRAPEILDVAEFTWQAVGGIGDNKVDVIRGRGKVMAGKLKIYHGHEKGKQLSAPVNQARGMFLKYLSSALEGHGHRTSEHNEPTDDGDVICCRSTGCLCGLWPEWAIINKWDQSFATVDVAKDGTYECQLHRIKNGRVY